MTTVAQPSSDQKKIFEGIVVLTIVSKTLPPEEAEKINKQIEEFGGKHVALVSSNLEEITHIVSSTSDFEAFHDAVDALIHVVKPSWVDQSILKRRAQNTRNFSPDPAMFMSGVILTFTDDIPQGDKDAIIGGMNCFGGTYSEKLTKLCTHVIALDVEKNDMCRLIQEKKLPIKVVLPHWFDDCLKLGKLISADPYTLPDPRILRPDCTASNRILSSQDIEGACTLSPDPPSAEIAQHACTVLRGRAVKLDENLGISAHLCSTLESIIGKGGGTVVPRIKNADILVCKFRLGKDYRLASQQGLTVGNLSWLYYLINWNTWTDPMRRLLHYPLPKNGVPNFKGFQIALSNYSGEARVYLESLIRATGGTYTRNLSPENSHLIAAHSKSEKVDAAKAWNLNVVNHLWLEESYALNTVQTISRSTYTTFPEGTNLGSVVGKTMINRDAMKHFFYPDDTVESTKSTPTRPPRVPAAITPAEGKENKTPSSRGAKDRALNKLHKMAPDIAAYEKESKRVGGVIYGGRRVNDPERIILKKVSTSRKRGRAESDEDAEGQSTQDEAESEHHTKKTKKETSVARLNVLATALGQMVSEEDLRRLNELPGIRMLSEIPHDPSIGIDILIAPSVKRTTKFFAGVAAGAQIVNQNWIAHALKSGSFDAGKFKLQDGAAEREYNSTLTDAVKRAKQHRARGGLLKGWSIFCTEGIKGGPDMMRAIVEINGGSLALCKGRRTAPPPLTRRLRAKIEKSASGAKSSEDEEINAEGDEAAGEMKDEPGKNRLFCLTIDGASDRKHWDNFCDIAREGGYVPCLVKTEWLLHIALTQDLNMWEPEWEFKTSAPPPLKGVGTKRA